MVVVDLSTVSEDDLVFLRQNLFAANVIGMGCVFIKREFRREEVISFGASLLLIHLPQVADLVDWLIQYNHHFEPPFRGLISIIVKRTTFSRWRLRMPP